MTFLPDGTIGMGQAGCERYWKYTLRDGNHCLIILSEAHAITCELSQINDSLWKGYWIVHEKMPIILTAIQSRVVLIQQAGAEQCNLLQLTNKRHSRYAQQYFIDFWSICGAVQFERPPEWNKILLLRRALHFSYDLAIWLNTNALIYKISDDLREASSEFQHIGMTRTSSSIHEQSSHYNHDVIFVKNTSASIRYLDNLWSSWDGRYQDNTDIYMSRYFEQSEAGVITAIQSKWNSRTCNNSQDQPIVKTWNYTPPVNYMIAHELLHLQNIEHNFDYHQLPFSKTTSSDSSIKYFHESSNRHYDARYYRGQVPPGKQRDLLISALTEFTIICHKCNIQPILMHGALLGWFWNRRLLPWDDDIDICLNYADMIKLDALLGLEGICYDKQKYLLDINPNYPNRNTLNSSVDINVEPNKIDARFIELSSGLFIDITALFPQQEGNQVGTKCPHLYDRDDIFPLAESTIEGVDIWIPAHVQKILEQEYGTVAITQPYYGRFKFDSKINEWIIVN